jgi:hypothetical protein
MCVRIFIDVSGHTCMSIYVCTLLLKISVFYDADISLPHAPSLENSQNRNIYIL